jgi:hypothetical protein
VETRIDDQTVFLPLGGILDAGKTTRVRLAFDATLQTDVAGPNWLFTRSGGIVQLYRWLPWFSVERSSRSPSFGVPFVTPVSPRVTLEITTDRPLKIATGALRTGSTPLRQTFVARNVRDVSIAASPTYEVATTTFGDTRVELFTRDEAPVAALMQTARRTLEQLESLLGPYPYPVLRIVHGASDAVAVASPGMIWLQPTTKAAQLPGRIAHELAHQWFYALVGNDLAREPFAHEATSEFMERHLLRSFGPSRCPASRLDRSLYEYSSDCYHQIIYVDGANFLESVRSRMGDTTFWRAIRSYLSKYRFAFGGTERLLRELDVHTPLDLRPTFKERFPSLF